MEWEWDAKNTHCFNQPARNFTTKFLSVSKTKLLNDECVWFSESNVQIQVITCVLYHVSNTFQINLIFFLLKTSLIHFQNTM